MLSLYGAVSLPVLAQLPATNMGKFVHQPGDNQYTDQTQSERHGSPAPVRQMINQRQAAPSTAVSSGAYVPTPKPPRPDISLLPIVAEEPLKPAGFPPLPDRLDLPVSAGWTRDSSPRMGQIGSGAGSAAAAGQNYPDISKPQGMHQHYLHYQPGAFQTQQERQQAHPGNVDYNNGGGSAPAAPASHGYYKAADYYNVNSGNRNASAAVPAGGTVDAIRALGKEPRLGNDAPAQPEAPAAVAVNQSTTQDLSLPEDDFAKQSPQGQNNAGKQMGRAVGNMAIRTLYTGAAMGYSMARYR
jgi:hypothetical protein